MPGSTLAAVSSGLAGWRSADSGRAAFLAGAFLATAFFAAGFLAAVFFTAVLAAGSPAGVFFAAAFFTTGFFAPNPLRAGLPVSASSCSASSSVSEAGSRSFGILPLSLPSLM